MAVLTKMKSKTPITDRNQCRFSSLFAGEDAYWVHAKVCRELEVHNARLIEALKWRCSEQSYPMPDYVKKALANTE